METSLPRMDTQLGPIRRIFDVDFKHEDYAPTAA